MSNSLQPHGLYSPTGSSVCGAFQAGILEWVSSSSSRGSSSPRDQTHVFCKSPALQADILSLSYCRSPIVCFVFFVQLLSRVWLFVTLQTIWVLQARILECHFLLQRFLDQGSNACLLHWQADSLPLSHQGSPIVCLPTLYSHFFLPFPWPGFFEDVHKVSSKEFFWNSKSVFHLTVSIRDIFFNHHSDHIFLFSIAIPWCVWRNEIFGTNDC